MENGSNRRGSTGSVASIASYASGGTNGSEFNNASTVAFSNNENDRFNGLSIKSGNEADYARPRIRVPLAYRKSKTASFVAAPPKSTVNAVASMNTRRRASAVPVELRGVPTASLMNRSSTLKRPLGSTRHNSIASASKPAAVRADEPLIENFMARAPLATPKLARSRKQTQRKTQTQRKQKQRQSLRKRRYV